MVDGDAALEKEIETMEQKKIIDAFNELREKYDVNRLRDKLAEDLKSDVSGKTTARVLSYYVADPTSNSSEIPDPNERASNVVAADVTRAFQFAPEELRFDHTFSFKDRDEESDRFERLRIDEYNADAHAGSDLRLIRLLDTFLEIDPLIYHKFVACTSLDVRKREATVDFTNYFENNNYFDKDKFETVSYTVEQLVEIISDAFYLCVPYDEIYVCLLDRIYDVELVKDILTQAENLASEIRDARRFSKDDEESYAKQAVERLKKHPWLRTGCDWENYLKDEENGDDDMIAKYEGGIIDDRSGMTIIHTNACSEDVSDGPNGDCTERRLRNIVESLLYSGFDYKDVLEKLTESMGDNDKAEKITEEGRRQYTRTRGERRQMLLDGKISEKEEAEYKERVKQRLSDLGLLRRRLLDVTLEYSDGFDGENFDGERYTKII